MAVGGRGRAVVVGIDGSVFGLRAARWGADEALRRGVPLRLVHAFEWIDETSRLLGDAARDQHYREIALARARRELAAAAVAADAQAPGVEVEQQLVVGFVVEVLAAESRRAGLVVVGDRGLTRVEGILMGSVPVGLVRCAVCPVAVVRGEDDAARAGAPVVVGVDGSPLSEAAIAYAFDAAATRRVALVAVHTYSELPRLTDREVIAVEEQALLAERLAGWSAKYPDVRVQRIVTRGRPVPALLDQARLAQLVVVGSRRHGDLTGAVLGSVSNTMLHMAACPVAVVPAEPAARAQSR